MYKTVVVPAGSLAAAGTVYAGAGELSGLDVVDQMIVRVTLQGITGGTLDVSLEIADRAADQWVTYATFPQIAAAAAQSTRFWSVSRSGLVTSNTALAGDVILGGDFGERMRVKLVVGAGASAGATQTIELIGSDTKRRN